MAKQLLHQEQFIHSRIIVKERNLLNRLLSVVKKRSLTQNDLDEVSSTVSEYYHELQVPDSETNIKVDSLLRVLRILLVFPIRRKIDTSFTEKIYKEFSLINNVTYHIYQLSDKMLNSSLIDNFMYYIKGSSIESLCTFFLYRLNPEYIKANYSIPYVDSLTPEELYYGVSTGYYSMKNGSNDAVLRLHELAQSDDIRISSPAKTFINQIIDDGFYLN